MILLFGEVAKKFCRNNETVLWLAGETNSAVTMRLFVGQLAKQMLQL
jgi:hypothetical protein